MGASPDNPAERPATERAEALLSRTGQRLAIWALQTRQRMQEAINSVRTEADHMDQPEEVTPQQRSGKAASKALSSVQQPSQVVTPSGTARAEVAVDALGQRIGIFAAATSLQVRRVTALMREGVEDIWAEAQDIRERSLRRDGHPS